VYLCYPNFVNVIVQRPVVEIILPVVVTDHRMAGVGEIVFEPDAVQMLEHLVVRYVEASVYHAYLELVASEHSARVVAMHAASESATELVEEMTSDLNRTRQAAITEELCDVTASAELLITGGTHD
jgi:F-type H+-transporting ATPase subunit gamma